jgi:hypothetical protein
LSSIEKCVDYQCLPKTEFSWKTSNAANIGEHNWLYTNNYIPEKAIVNDKGKIRELG